jgi:hypothetical protein
MKLATITVTGVGRSNVCAVDDFQVPVNVGIGAKLTGTATFNIEYSFDDPMADGYTAGTATWYIAPSLGTLSATTGGSLTIPCKAISINITANTGTVTATIIQAGPA